MISAVARPVRRLRSARRIGDVAEGGRHQQELRVGQQQERHLPRPAAVRVAVEVELVHHDQADIRVGAVPQARGWRGSRPCSR